MRRLLLGLGLASFPLALLAQPLNQPPSSDGSFTQGNSRVIIMPLPPDRSRAPGQQDGTVTPMPAQDDQTAPGQPGDTVTAPPPLSNPADQGPVDNSVTATPLPPPADAPGSNVQVVPNASDGRNGQSAGSTTVPVAPNPPEAPAGQSAGSNVQIVPNPSDTQRGQSAGSNVQVMPSPSDTQDGQSAGSNVQVVPNPPDTQDGQSSGSTMEVVPNPLDTPNSQAAPGKPTQTQGQAEPGGWIKMGTATLQALDKVNAEEKTLVVKVGDSGHFDSLDIAVQGCYVRPSDRPADATAFLVIRDQHSDSDKPAFRGWMVRSAPYMSMMAHPLYDVQVAGCSP